MSKQNKPVSGKKLAKVASRHRQVESGEPKTTNNGVQSNEKKSSSIIVNGRVAKILARSGIASRREIERMIKEGRVKLNNTILTSPAVNVSQDDKIEVDGKLVADIERTRLWLYHKPGGLVTTNHDPEGRATVFENLPENLPRVVSIGRLDINTEGLLLLTNDGGLARVLELPSTGWLRRYRVRAHGKIDQARLDQLKDGFAVNGMLYGSIDAILDRVQGSNVWITMSLREGKNREIKVVLEELGLNVNRLIRLSYGPFQLGELPEGNVIEVRGRLLRDQLGPRLAKMSGANFDAPLRQYNNGEEGKNEERKNKGEKTSRGIAAKTDHKVTKTDYKDRNHERAKARPESFKDKRKSSDSKFTPRDEKQNPSLPRNRAKNVWVAKGGRPTVEKKPDNTQYGHEPIDGNWHRPKDKLDPQKSFRAKNKNASQAKMGKHKKPDTAKNPSRTKNISKMRPNADRRR